MAYLALLWKGRTIEKYRINYEKEKLESLLNNDADLPKNYFTEKHKHFQRDTRKKMEQTFKQWCPNIVANVLFYLTTDQTFPNFLLKSALGFGGGIILTYLCFMFFVFQLSISLMHATIMSCVIGVLLTLGLAFSYRVRCLVFLLIPQFFSRVGRYTLTCYALILILTGPATNTLKNSEVLSESMACGQEQIKLHVHQLNDFLKNPLNLVRDSIKNIVERMKYTSSVFREMLHRTNRLALSIVRIFQSSFLWLHSTAPLCNEEFGTPYERCVYLLDRQISRQNVTYYNNLDSYNEYRRIVEAICSNVKNRELICAAHEYAGENIGALVKRRLKNFSEHIKAMLYLDIKIHHTYSYCGNVNKTASQTAAGIVTEIRNRADPLITWLSWSSCGTSLFLFLIIFRAKYYQHMFETRSRFDNQYVTKELRDLDLKRQKQGRETILPLNRREQMKYISATSFKLVPSERVYLSRSAVFMTITTFKLLIHIVADYSLFWILTIIRQHGRFQTTLPPGYTNAGIKASGTGPVARFLQNIIDSLNIPLATPSPSPITCLPDPLPPDLRRYTQIGVLIVLLWFFALFEPYGLRLRHVIMGMYRPERAKARAAWLYNHILTTRGSFMKYARRKLHRQFKYSTESKYTFRYWLNSYIPCWWLQTLLGTAPDEPHCLLCSTKEYIKDSDTKLVRCETPDCPGIFCVSCFSDIGELCTICLPPADYGDLSDVSLEKGSSDDDTDDGHNDAAGKPSTSAQLGKNYETLGMFKQYKRRNQDKYSKTSKKGQENIPLLKRLISYDMVTEIQVNLINVEVTGESKLKTKVYVDFNNNTIESAVRLTQLKLNIQVSQTLCLKKYYSKEDNFDIKTYVDIKQFFRIKPSSHLIFVSDQFTPFMFDESISGKFSTSKEEIGNNRRHGINYERSRKLRKRRTRKISCNKCCCLKKLCCLFSCAKNSVKSHHSGIIKSPSALSLSKVVATKQVSHIKRSDSKKRTKKKSDTAINIYFQNVHCLNFQSSSGVGLYDLKGLANKDFAIKKSIDTNKQNSCACVNDSRKTSKEFVDNTLRKDNDPVHSITNKKSCINFKNNAELNIMRAEKSIRKNIDSKEASKKESLKIKSDNIIRKKEIVDKYPNLSDSKVNTMSKSPKRTAKQYEEKKLQKSNVALSLRKSKTVDKFALAVPKVKSSACQCYASDSVRTNKHTTRNDKRMKHVTSQCTCATQYYTETRDVGILAHVKSPKCTKEKTMKHIEKAAKKMFQQEETGSEMSSISSSAYSRVIQFVQVFKENRTKKHGTNTIKKNKEHPTNDNDWWSPMMKKKEIITSSDSDKCNDQKTLCLQRKNVKPNNDTDVRIEINTRHHKKKIQETPTWKKI